MDSLLSGGVSVADVPPRQGGTAAPAGACATTFPFGSKKTSLQNVYNSQSHPGKMDPANGEREQTV
jgi:hypothetical protein